MKKRVFIDGQHGTTGLKIHDRLKGRDDVEIIEIDKEKKKDAAEKAGIINEVDLVFLCLPDDSARESAALVTNPRVRIIDGSSAHRVSQGWAYGIPELSETYRNKIVSADRVSVPGCYATGFNMCMHPLVSQGIVPVDYPIVTYAITGYSGGGRKMIEDFESPEKQRDNICCRPKNLDLAHKHLPEMKVHGLLERAPIFSPIVGDFYQGMLVFIPLYKNLLSKKMNAKDLREFFTDYFSEAHFVHVIESDVIERIGADFISPTACNATNDLEIFVFDQDERVMIVSRLDNLGKGASGAAVQCMNIMTETDEREGL